MRVEESREPMMPLRPRRPSFDLTQPEGRQILFGLRGPRGIRAGDETVEVGVLQQIVETGQSRALAQSMRHLVRSKGPSMPLRDLIEAHDAWLDEAGLDGLERPAAYDLSRPRRFELAAALNRWRALRWRAGEE
jgi:predicted metal-dependent phosphoesterase TrpH